MSNRTTETVPCPKCGGSGKVAVRRVDAFKVGDKVWWKAARTLWYYGWHDAPVPSEVASVSEKRVLIRFQDTRHQCSVHLYIDPKYLEPRNE